MAIEETLEEMAKRAFAMKTEYIKLYDAGDLKMAKELEYRYLELRKQVLDMTDDKITRQKAEVMREVKKRVYAREAPVRIETGIRKLDFELATVNMYGKNQIGGFSLGNFVQIAGSRGSGKSSMMMKILTNFSNYEKVCWFDFEMGENRVVEKLEDFHHNEDNLMYYSSSRYLSDVVNEIKFLHSLGVHHFVIDSAMKIDVPNVDRYERFSIVSSRLSSLTSSLLVNIYMINQLSQNSEKEGHLMLKHGNDAEYDADFLFYLLQKPLIENGKNVKDDLGMPKVDPESRILKCTKNRQDDRLFTVELSKSDIFGISPEEYTFEFEEE